MKRNVFICLIGLLLSPGCSCNTQPGNGQKIGNVVKVTKVGIMSQTWEAQLIRGGMSGGNGSFGVTPFDFTIETDDLALKCLSYMTNQTEVIISYRTELISSAFRTESRNHYLVSIEPARPASK